MSATIYNFLGKMISYPTKYDPKLLFPISRSVNRAELGSATLPVFHGIDVWRAFEISWLNLQGKPLVAVGEFIFSAHSPNLIESKSFKLYLNSLNGARFASAVEVLALLKRDLSAVSESKVEVKLDLIDSIAPEKFTVLNGTCIDDIEVECPVYHPDASFLHVNERQVNETLYSHLLKSNCPVTNQPDWGSVEISYLGREIDRAGLVQYIVSFRDHSGFHEQCVERMYVDIMSRCSPDHLTIQALYTRRGGLDINPLRSSHEVIYQNKRLVRQ